MKKNLLLALTFIALACSPKNKDTTLKVMTYNIRLNIASDAENAWPNRKTMLTSQVLFLAPDVMGVQEALPNQMKDLKSHLNHYNFIGKGRDGDENGEYSAIFYNSEKLTVADNGTFWLSKTPDKISKGWDAAYPRICTYGLFTVKNTDQKFWVFNTHFDHVGVEARNESAKLILKKMKTINKQDYPIVMMGDLNAEPQTNAITEISSYLNDAKDISKLQFVPNGTFNGFNYNAPTNRRIDYIFVSKSPKVEVEKYAVFNNSMSMRFPSDHFPVYSEVRLSN